MYRLSRKRSAPLLLLITMLAGAYVFATAQAALLVPDGTVKLVYFFEEDDKFVVSDIRSGAFVELRRQANEKLIDKAVANQVVILVTNRRYVAYSAQTQTWHEFKRRAKEGFVRVEAADFSAFLVTTDRLISFNGLTGTWSEHRR